MKNFKQSACSFSLQPSAFSLLPFALCLLPFAFCLAQKTVLVDGIAAHVNSHVITIHEVMREIPGGILKDLPKDEREERLREIFNATLSAMIDGRLILDEAKATGAQLAPWVVNNRAQEILDTFFKGDRAQLVAELAKDGKTHDEWRKELADDMLIQYMRHHNVERVTSVAPKDVRAHYAANTADFVSPETADVSLVVLEAFEDDALAEIGKTVDELLGKGVAFERVAQTLSGDETRGLGKVTHTNLGAIVPADVLRPELAEAVAKIRDKGHTPLLVVDGVGYILRRNASTPSRQLTLEDAWPLIENRLREKLARERYQSWVKMLRAKNYVKVFELPEK